MTLANAILKYATLELGKEEEPRGSNWGDDVKKYLLSVGITFPASWCMAFVYWCHEQACEELGIPNKMFKTGGVLYQYVKSKSLAVKSPQPGDVGIMDHGKGLGHTFIVEWVEKEIVHTIEGNTNDEGSREGYEVCKRQRNIKTVKAFLRFS